MRATGPLTSVADAQRRARRELPASVYSFLCGGAGAGHAMRRNLDSFAGLCLRGRAGDLPFAPDMSTTVLGQELSMPVLVSPLGAAGLWPNATVEVAAGAARAGTTLGVSNMASEPMADVVRANSKAFAQLYWAGNREQIEERLEVFRRAGAAGLIVTIDFTFGPGVDWDRAMLPMKVGVRELLGYVPTAIAHPAWASRFVLGRAIPDMQVPNFYTSDQPSITMPQIYGQMMHTPPITWADVAWLKERWGGPLMVKGILDVDDARRAVDAGADAISVSNHGGNDSDDGPAPLHVLPGIVDAVGDDLEVLVDGGVRRGTDVVKAVALGARAVMIGRAAMWALAARGADGVHEVLELMRIGIRQGLRASKVQSVHELDRSHVVSATTWSGADMEFASMGERFSAGPFRHVELSAQAAVSEPQRVIAKAD